MSRICSIEGCGRQHFGPVPIRNKQQVGHVNNRAGNLEIWVSLQPVGQRPADLVKWATEILALYGPWAQVIG